MHCREVRIGKSIRFEVGQTPVGFAVARLTLNTLSIGVDALGGLPCRLQHMAVTRPDLGILRVFTEQAGIQFYRPVIVSGSAQNDRAQVAIARVFGIGSEGFFDFDQRVVRVISPMQDHGQVITRRGESRGKLEASQQQIFRIFILAATHGDFRQHPDRGHVGRLPHQVLFQQALGKRDLVLDHRRGSLSQHRIAGRALNMAGISEIATLGITDGQQVIRQNAPRLRMFRLILHCF